MSDDTKPESRLENGEPRAERDAMGRFLPGTVPNPGGRPKSAHLSRALRVKLAQVDPHSKEGKTFAEQIADALVKRALGGDVRAIAEIADRVEGKARQTFEVTTLQQKFERMTPEELRTYADTGQLPEWFDGAGPSLPPVNDARPRLPTSSEIVDGEFVVERDEKGESNV